MLTCIMWKSADWFSADGFAKEHQGRGVFLVKFQVLYASNFSRNGIRDAF